MKLLEPKSLEDKDIVNSINKDMAQKLAPKAIGITKEELESRLPRGTNHKVTDKVLDAINNMEKDIDLDQGMMEEKIISSLHLLGQGLKGVTLEKYVNAVKYVNLKKFMLNKEAYSIVFRKKYNELISKGKQVDNFVAMYNQTDLVVELDKQSILPAHVEYNHVYHEMISNLANVARGQSTSGKDVSPMVQVQAASKLLDHLAPPVENTIDLKVGMSDEAKSVQQELAEQLRIMNENQMKRLEAGESIDDVQKINIKIVDAEIVDE